MQLRKQLLLATSILAAVASIFYACKSQKNATASVASAKARVLVFTKTKGYYHTSIPEGARAIYDLGLAHNFAVDTSSDAKYFVEDSLKNYAAVVFLSTTQNVLNADQQVAFERYIQAGGGLLGYTQQQTPSMTGPGTTNW